MSRFVRNADANFSLKYCRSLTSRSCGRRRAVLPQTTNRLPHYALRVSGFLASVCTGVQMKKFIYWVSGWWVNCKHAISLGVCVSVNAPWILLYRSKPDSRDISWKQRIKTGGKWRLAVETWTQSAAQCWHLATKLTPTKDSIWHGVLCEEKPRKGGNESVKTCLRVRHWLHITDQERGASRKLSERPGCACPSFRFCFVNIRKQLKALRAYCAIIKTVATFCFEFFYKRRD